MEDEEEEEEDPYFAEIQISKAKKHNFKYIPFNSKNNFNKDDFEYLSVLGNGAYAKVVKAKFKKTNEIVAIKMIEKPFIEKVKSN